MSNKNDMAERLHQNNRILLSGTNVFLDSRLRCLKSFKHILPNVFFSWQFIMVQSKKSPKKQIQVSGGTFTFILPTGNCFLVDVPQNWVVFHPL